MADFNTLESSAALSQPVELYRFTQGSGSPSLFTSSEDDITIPSTGEIYQSEPGLRRTPVKKGQDARNQPLEISLPASNPFAALWQVRPPGIKGLVTVLRAQRAETPSIGTNTALIYKGQIDTVDYPGDGLEAVMAITSIESASATPAPRMNYKQLCNHYLYDQRCGVDPNLHKVTAVVTVESGNDITVPGVGAFPDGTFAAGFVKPGAVTDFRQILNQIGDVLTLDLPFKQPVLATSVDAFKGCDRLIDGDCLNVFNNVIEFGGWPFVPVRNPFQTGLL